MGRHGAAAVGERLLAKLSSPVSVAGRVVPVGASIGVAVNTAQAGSARDLLVAADQRRRQPLRS